MGQAYGFATLDSAGRLILGQRARGEDFYIDGAPSGMQRANLRRRECNGDLSALTTQVMTSVALYLEAGDTVTNLSFRSGATAADTPLHYWFALYDNSATPAKLAQSADQTTTAWAANTTKTLALATAQAITTTGVYYAAICMQATACVSLVGASLYAGASGAIVSGQKVLAQTSGSSLTATAPSTIATPTTIGTVPYCVAT